MGIQPTQEDDAGIQVPWNAFERIAHVVQDPQRIVGVSALPANPTRYFEERAQVGDTPPISPPKDEGPRCHHAESGNHDKDPERVQPHQERKPEHRGGSESTTRRHPNLQGNTSGSGK